LTLKVAKKQDLWFHVQGSQGSHVILRLDGKEASNEIILKCAQIAKENSKAKNSTHVCVDYCPVKNVRKPSGSKPGKVIYTNYNTIII
jgi:predicted ribosome quality control (RQC) complex YloA/Tae2 family protein